MVLKNQAVMSTKASCTLCIERDLGMMVSSLRFTYPVFSNRNYNPLPHCAFYDYGGLPNLGYLHPKSGCILILLITMKQEIFKIRMFHMSLIPYQIELQATCCNYCAIFGFPPGDRNLNSRAHLMVGGACITDILPTA